MKKLITLFLIVSFVAPAQLLAGYRLRPVENSEADKIHDAVRSYYCRAIVEYEASLEEQKQQQKDDEVARALIQKNSSFLSDLPADDTGLPTEVIVDDVKILESLKPGELRGLSAEICKKEIINDTNIMKVSITDLADALAHMIGRSDAGLYNVVVTNIIADYQNARKAVSGIAVYPKKPELIRSAIEVLIAKISEVVTPEISSYPESTAQDATITFIKGAMTVYLTVCAVGMGISGAKGLYGSGRGLREVLRNRGVNLFSFKGFRQAASAVRNGWKAEAVGVKLLTNGRSGSKFSFSGARWARLSKAKALFKFADKLIFQGTKSTAGKITKAALYTSGGIYTLSQAYLTTRKMDPIELLEETQKDIAFLDLYIPSAKMGDGLEELEKDLSVAKIEKAPIEEVIQLSKQLVEVKTEAEGMRAEYDYLAQIYPVALSSLPIAEDLSESVGMIERMLNKVLKLRGADLQTALESGPRP